MKNDIAVKFVVLVFSITSRIFFKFFGIWFFQQQELETLNRFIKTPWLTWKSVFLTTENLSSRWCKCVNQLMKVKGILVINWWKSRRSYWSADENQGDLIDPQSFLEVRRKWKLTSSWSIKVKFWKYDISPQKAY